MLLNDKTAVIYGAGGPIGRAAAVGFAREGARVFLSGRTGASLKTTAAAVKATGGEASVSIVDALDEGAVTDFVEAVVKETDRVDISFNAIGYGDIQKPLTEISVADFLLPITNAMRSQFLTTAAAVPHMIRRGSGVVLTFGGSGNTVPGLGGFKVALDAIESLRRQWACELGEHGIRLVTLKTGGIPESIPDDVPEKADITSMLEDMAVLKRTATLDDVGRIAAFVASDYARTVTGTAINMSCGAIME